MNCVFEVNRYFLVDELRLPRRETGLLCYSYVFLGQDLAFESERVGFCLSSIYLKSGVAVVSKEVYACGRSQVKLLNVLVLHQIGDFNPGNIPKVKAQLIIGGQSRSKRNIQWIPRPRILNNNLHNIRSIKFRHNSPRSCLPNLSIKITPRILI